ncbi:hypothetical protein [Micromonospora coerulea]|nr:hypothetical protein [Micromonospora veneta]
MTISRHDPVLLNRTRRTPWAGPGLRPRGHDLVEAFRREWHVALPV